MIDSKQLVEYAKHPELALQNLDELLSLLDGDDEAELSSASELLENCGAPSKANVSVLCSQLKSGSSARVYWSSTLLGRLGQSLDDPTDRNRILSGLGDVLDDEALELSARERAVWAIGELGCSNHPCRAILEKHVAKAQARLKRLLETALAT